MLQMAAGFGPGRCQAQPTRFRKPAERFYLLVLNNASKSAKFIWLQIIAEQGQ
jgi:hypothetical protein